MSYKDYENSLDEYRKSLSSKEWFIKKQSKAWKAAEETIGHHFSNTIVFLAIFLLGGLSVFLFNKCTQLQQIGETFWGGVLLALIFLVVAVCVCLVSLLRKKMGSVIFHAYVIDEITRTACLEEIGRYEYQLHEKIHGLVFSIKHQKERLSACSPSDAEELAIITATINEFTNELYTLYHSLDSLRSIRASYLNTRLFDLNIIDAVSEHYRNKL